MPSQAEEAGAGGEIGEPPRVPQVGHARVFPDERIEEVAGQADRFEGFHGLIEEDQEVAEMQIAAGQVICAQKSPGWSWATAFRISMLAWKEAIASFMRPGRRARVEPSSVRAAAILRCAFGSLRPFRTLVAS